MAQDRIVFIPWNQGSLGNFATSGMDDSPMVLITTIPSRGELTINVTGPMFTSIRRELWKVSVWAAKR
jgi:hypothetical protein